MDQNVTLAAAFIAGILSFLSPCVLPLLPTYTAFLTGTGGKTVGNKGKWPLLLNGLCFWGGFTLVFVIMGATASQIGQIFLDYQEEIRQIGAIFMVIMGLHLIGLLKVSLLQREYRPLLSNTLQGPFGAFALGVAFTAGWMPCVGPILASILMYASTAATLQGGTLLLFVYAMGFSLPFLLMTLLLNEYFYKVKKIYPYLPAMQQVSGIVLLITGVIIYFDLMQKVLGIVWG